MTDDSFSRWFHASSADSSLSEDDGATHELWQNVTKDIAPLSAKEKVQKPLAKKLSRAALNRSAEEAMHGMMNAVAQDMVMEMPDYPVPSRVIARPLWRKIAKGARELDAVIDLHDFTQDIARDQLAERLTSCWLQGARIVIVITGKGRAGQGVLRAALPDWLDMPIFRAIVQAYDTAAEPHGGSGAFYLHLRKAPAARHANNYEG